MSDTGPVMQTKGKGSEAHLRPGPSELICGILAKSAAQHSPPATANPRCSICISLDSVIQELRLLSGSTVSRIIRIDSKNSVR